MSFTDLPLLFDLLQPHTCKTSKDDSACTCYHEKFLKKTRLFVPDRRLQNWEQWMKKRKQIHQKLGEQLQRNPGSLVMNSAEEFRFVKEEKLALEYTKIPEPDEQRGCPGFWKVPFSIQNELGEETYFSVERKEDRCEIPVIEHVGLSNQVLEEKDVLPRTRNSQALWKRLPYVQHKNLKLSRRMKQVDPHKPDFTNLFIKGIPIGTNTIQIEKQHHKLQFSGAITSEVPETVISQSEDKPSKLSLSINDFHLNPNLQIGGTRKIYILFDYDINDKKVATEYLTLKNSGSTTIRFYWKASEKVEYFSDIIQDTSHEIYFYFNKNEGLIIPGQTIEFPVSFKTKQIGTFYEQWEFYTKPNVMPPDTRLIIVFHASALIGNMNERMEMIREQLDRNVRDRLIKEALNTVISNIPHEKFKPTVYCYNKREIFETINSQFDTLHRRPKYLYNKDVVRELQKFYKRVRRTSDPKVWNYQIEELRLITRAKQKREESQKRVIQQEESKRLYEARPKLQRLDCARASAPKLKDSKVKISSKSDTRLNQKTKTPLKEKPIMQQEKPLTEQLELIISKLEHGATDKNVEQTKYTQAYLILCTYFSKIGSEFEDLKCRLGIVKKTSYPKFQVGYSSPFYYKPVRLVHETLDEVLQGPSLMCKVGTNADKPAAEILKDIPKEDSKKRYRTYYNLPETPPLVPDKKGKPAKGDAKPDKKAGKDDKKDAKKKEEKPVKNDSDEDDKYVVNEMFDPYAKVELPTIKNVLEEEQEEDDETESNFDQIPQAICRQYKYNLYVIMYNYLDQAIINIVDMIEMRPKENLSYPLIIKEFEEPKYYRRLIDLKGLLAEENAQEFKARLVLYKYRKHSKKDWKTIEIERQLKCAKSDSSLWSLLRPYETKIKLPEEKPISYPIDHYDDSKKEKVDSIEDVGVNISTSSVDGRQLDLDWEDFKDVGVQKDYDEKEKPDDLEEYIEKIVSEISAQDLFDIKLEKATQKRSLEHISDEEYFYDSESDVDAKLLLDSSIESELNSEKYEEDSCSCEGFGICNLSVEDECSCEGYGECNLPIEEECSCEGLGECALLLEEEYGESSLMQTPKNKKEEKSSTPSVQDVYICPEKCNTGKRIEKKS